jgi:hypothetical protein
MLTMYADEMYAAYDVLFASLISSIEAEEG